MAFVTANRVKETSTTTGTGTYTLAGAATGFESFATVGDGNICYYCATDGTDWEVGIGTYTLSGTTLARTAIIQSSNSDAAVNWAAGTRDIFVTLPASQVNKSQVATLNARMAAGSTKSIASMYTINANVLVTIDAGAVLLIN